MQSVSQPRSFHKSEQVYTNERYDQDVRLEDCGLAMPQPHNFTEKIYDPEPQTTREETLSSSRSMVQELTTDYHAPEQKVQETIPESDVDEEEEQNLTRFEEDEQHQQRQQELDEVDTLLNDILQSDSERNAIQHESSFDQQEEEIQESFQTEEESFEHKSPVFANVSDSMVMRDFEQIQHSIDMSRQQIIDTSDEEETVQAPVHVEEAEDSTSSSSDEDVQLQRFSSNNPFAPQNTDNGQNIPIPDSPDDAPWTPPDHSDPFASSVTPELRQKIAQLVEDTESEAESIEQKPRVVVPKLNFPKDSTIEALEQLQNIEATPVVVKNDADSAAGVMQPTPPPKLIVPESKQVRQPQKPQGKGSSGRKRPMVAWPSATTNDSFQPKFQVRQGGAQEPTATAKRADRQRLGQPVADGTEMQSRKKAFAERVLKRSTFSSSSERSSRTPMTTPDTSVVVPNTIFEEPEADEPTSPTPRAPSPQKQEEVVSLPPPIEKEWFEPPTPIQGIEVEDSSICTDPESPLPCGGKVVDLVTGEQQIHLRRLPSDEETDEMEARAEKFFIGTPAASPQPKIEAEEAEPVTNMVGIPIIQRRPPSPIMCDSPSPPPSRRKTATPIVCDSPSPPPSRRRNTPPPVSMQLSLPQPEDSNVPGHLSKSLPSLNLAQLSNRSERPPQIERPSLIQSLASHSLELHPRRSRQPREAEPLDCGSVMSVSRPRSLPPDERSSSRSMIRQSATARERSSPPGSLRQSNITIHPPSPPRVPRINLGRLSIDNVNRIENTTPRRTVLEQTRNLHSPTAPSLADQLEDALSSCRALFEGGIDHGYPQAEQFESEVEFSPNGGMRSVRQSESFESFSQPSTSLMTPTIEISAPADEVEKEGDDLMEKVRKLLADQQETILELPRKEDIPRPPSPFRNVTYAPSFTSCRTERFDAAAEEAERQLQNSLRVATDVEMWLEKETALHNQLKEDITPSLISPFASSSDKPAPVEPIIPPSPDISAAFTTPFCTLPGVTDVALSTELDSRLGLNSPLIDTPEQAVIHEEELIIDHPVRSPSHNTKELLSESPGAMCSNLVDEMDRLMKKMREGNPDILLEDIQSELPPRPTSLPLLSVRKAEEEEKLRLEASQHIAVLSPVREASQEPRDDTSEASHPFPSAKASPVIPNNLNSSFESLPATLIASPMEKGNNTGGDDIIAAARSYMQEMEERNAQVHASLKEKIERGIFIDEIPQHQPQEQEHEFIDRDILSHQAQIFKRMAETDEHILENRRAREQADEKPEPALTYEDLQGKYNSIINQEPSPVRDSVATVLPRYSPPVDQYRRKSLPGVFLQNTPVNRVVRAQSEVRGGSELRESIARVTRGDSVARAQELKENITRLEQRLNHLTAPPPMQFYQMQPDGTQQLMQFDPMKIANAPTVCLSLK